MMQIYKAYLLNSKWSSFSFVKVKHTDHACPCRIYFWKYMYRFPQDSNKGL